MANRLGQSPWDIVFQLAVRCSGKVDYRRRRRTVMVLPHCGYDAGRALRRLPDENAVRFGGRASGPRDTV